MLVLAAGLSVLSVRSGRAVWTHWSYGARTAYLSFALEMLFLIAVLLAVHRLGKILLARLAPAKQSSEKSKSQSSLASYLPGLGLAVLVAFVITFLVSITAKTNVGTSGGKMVYGSERGQIIFAALAAGFLSTLAVFPLLNSCLCFILGFNKRCRSAASTSQSAKTVCLAKAANDAASTVFPVPPFPLMRTISFTRLVLIPVMSNPDFTCLSQSCSPALHKGRKLPGYYFPDKI